MCSMTAAVILEKWKEIFFLRRLAKAERHLKAHTFLVQFSAFIRRVKVEKTRGIILNECDGKICFFSTES